MIGLSLRKLVCFLFISGYFFIAWTPTAWAHSLVPLNLSELSQDAELIFVGVVRDVEEGLDEWNIPSTFYRIFVEQAIKGNIESGSVFHFKQFGRVHPNSDGGVHAVIGLPSYVLGQRYLLALTGASDWGFRSAVGAGQGSFLIDGENRALNFYDNAGLFLGDEQGSLRYPVKTKSNVVSTESTSGTQRSVPVDLLIRKLLQLVAAPLRKGASISLLTSHQSQPILPTGNPLTTDRSGDPLVWGLRTTLHPGGTLDAIPYHVDQGSLGMLSNEEARSLVARAFAVWTGIGSAAIAVREAGQLPVDVDITNWTTFLAETQPDGFSPIVFDADGSLTDAALGEGASCSILGFAGPVWAQVIGNFFILEARAILNGMWIDGQDNLDKCNRNTEIPVSRFEGTFVHEFGHYIGLGHSQVNGTARINGQEILPGVIGIPPLDSVVTMFPLDIGQDNATLELDDRVTASLLYPTTSFLLEGKISGRILKEDGTSLFNCANVVARSLIDPFFTAVSNVSGARFNPNGPSTGGGVGGFQDFDGVYELPGLPSGEYLVQVTQISEQFRGGSRLVSCDPPRSLPSSEEFYNGLQESADPILDNPFSFTPVNVSQDAIGINIILNATRPSTPSFPPIGESTLPPQDLDGDGKFEDVNGDGRLTVDDAILLVRAVLVFNDPTVQHPAFDFNDDGFIDIDDAIGLARIALGVSQQMAAELLQEALGLVPLSLTKVSAGIAGMDLVFVAEGQGIFEINVSVYDLGGRLVFDSGFVPALVPLRWNLLDLQGHTVANGVYLYSITVKGRYNQSVHSAIKKIVILR